MDNVEIKKSNLEAAYKQADDNTKKMLATLFGDAITTKDDRPVTERIKTFEDAMAALDSNHPCIVSIRTTTFTKNRIEKKIGLIRNN